jgi:D-3-phosphoglycerate dehydrogenase / 2-oxoglutarate reductase
VRIAIGPSSFGEADRAPLDELERHGFEVVANPVGRRLTEAEISAHLDGVDGLIAGLEPLTRRVLTSAPRLRAIARVGVGMDNVDLATAAELGIAVSSTPDAPAESVAEATVGAMILLSRSMLVASDALHEGRWEKSIGRNLSESVVLIIGFGRIGQRVASLLRALGAQVMACDPFLDPDHATEIDVVTLDEGLARAHVISLHAAGDTPIIGAREIDLMSPGAVLINAGRGNLVDEDALIDALESGIISGAWLDVFASEPYQGPLSGYPQVLLTPHMATYTRQTRRRMELEAVANLMSCLSSPQV